MAGGSVAEPDDGFSEIRVPAEGKLAGVTTGDIDLGFGGDVPAGAAEAIEGIVNGVAIAGGVDDLDDDTLAADAVDAFEHPGFAEDVPFEIGEGEVAGGEPEAGEGQAIEAVGGIGDLNELPEQGEDDGEPEDNPEESAVHGGEGRDLAFKTYQRSGVEARAVVVARAPMRSDRGRPCPAQEKAGIQAMAEASQSRCCQEAAPRAAKAQARPR